MFRRLSPELKDPAHEAAFRASDLPREKRVAAFVLLAGILFLMASTGTDRSLLSGTPLLLPAIGIRAFGAGTAVAVLFWMRRASGPRAFDRILFLWVALVFAGVAVTNAFFPPEFTTWLAWDPLLVLAAWTVVPLPLRSQGILAGLMTSGSVWVALTQRSFLLPVAIPDLLLALLCANLIGVAVSWELHRARRLQFTALEAAEEARRRLEAAQAEIRTLRGIIPICALCKKVRTDAGSWRKVESYVQEHTDAEFSHGICPTCESTLYAEADEEAGPS